MFDVLSGGSLAQFGTGLPFAAAALCSIYGFVAVGQQLRGRPA